MYTGNPDTNPIDALRLQLGDTDENNPWLTDNDYQFYLNKYPNNSGRKIVIAAAQAILFKLAKYTRERAGQIEVYGSDVYRNYSDAIERFIKDSSFNGVYPLSYFGGISKIDEEANNANPDVIQKTFKTGDSENGIDSCYFLRAYNV